MSMEDELDEVIEMAGDESNMILDVPSLARLIVHIVKEAAADGVRIGLEAGALREARTAELQRLLRMEDEAANNAPEQPSPWLNADPD